MENFLIRKHVLPHNSQSLSFMYIFCRLCWQLQIFLMEGFFLKKHLAKKYLSF